MGSAFDFFFLITLLNICICNFLINKIHHIFIETLDYTKELSNGFHL